MNYSPQFAREVRPAILNSTSFQFGANFKIVGKTDPQKLSYSGAFTPIRGTLQDLAKHIEVGYPWMPALLDKGAPRWQSKANYAEILAADIDEGLTLDEALAHPLISQNACLAIESASSTPEHNKFRLVFRLQMPIYGWENIRCCNQYLIELLRVADRACKDSSRFFFGAPGRKPFLLDESKFLPRSFVDDALAWHEKQERIAEKQYQSAVQTAEARRSLYGEPSKQDQLNLVREALVYIPPKLKAGDGMYSACFPIAAAIAHEFPESDAIALIEGWSPSICGTTWNVPQMVRSIVSGRHEGRKAGLGTVFKVAIDNGFQFPRSDRQQYDPSDEPAYQQYVVREQERVRCEQAEETERLRLGFGKLLQKVQKPKQRRHRERVEPIKADDFTTITLRDRSEIFDAYEYAILADYRHILDRRGTGAGKSYSAGILDPSRFATEVETEEGIQRKNAHLWYFTKESRNPSTKTIEANFEELPVRNHGMNVHGDRTTPLGNPVTRPIFDRNNPLGKGNCQNAHLFLLIGEKNLPTESGAEASSHPICTQCPFNRPRPGEKGSECASHEGEGYGFRKQRKEAIAAERLRLNLQSTPSELPHNTIGIWEEVSEQLNPIVRNLNLNDFNAQWAAIRDYDFHLATQLYPIEKALRFAMGDTSSPFGKRESNFAEVITSIDIRDRQELLNKLYPVLTHSLEEVLGRQPVSNEAAKSYKSLQGKIERLFKKIARLDITKPKEAKRFEELKEKFEALNAEASQAQKEAEQFEANRKVQTVRQNVQAIDNINAAPVQGLWDVLNILLKPNQGFGGFVAHNDVISVYLPNDRALRIIAQTRANIYLDATIQPQVLCDKLGISRHELLVIEDDRPKIDNVKHFQILGFGNCARDRAKSTNGRLKELHVGIQEHAAKMLGTDKFEVALADYKNVADIDSDHQHLSDTRGSNKSEGKQVLIDHGLPKPNLGAIQSEYATLRNPSYSFEQFYQDRVDSEIRQLSGRLRANLYPEKNFLIYWVTEEPIPFESEQIQSIDLRWEAAPKSQKIERSIFAAICEAVRQGTKLTQNLIAQLAECTQGYISQWFAVRGGWGFWKKLLTGKQVEDLEAYRSQLSEEEQTLTEVLPLEIVDAGDDARAVVSAVDEVFQIFGDDAFVRIWQGIARNVRDRLIAALLTLDNQRYWVGR